MPHSALILSTFWKTSMGFIFVAIFCCPIVSTHDRLNFPIAPWQNDVMLSTSEGNSLGTHFPTFIVRSGNNLLFFLIDLKYFDIYYTSEMPFIDSDLKYSYRAQSFKYFTEGRSLSRH